VVAEPAAANERRGTCSRRVDGVLFDQMTRPVRAGVIGLGIVGLLVLVAIAARGTHPGTNGDVATRAVPDSVQDGFVTLLAVTYALVVAAILIALFKYKHRWRERKSNWLLNIALVTVVMLVATGIGYYGMRHSLLRHRVSQVIHGQAGGSNQRPRSRSGALPARQAHFQWPLALGVVGLFLLGGVWIYVRRRREFPPHAARATLESALVDAIEITIDDLRNERDARKAVIAAYAVMEHTLTAHGLPRDRAEAPLEYLGRILRALDVREAAVATLTSLFEYAKFSRHDVDAGMKEEAIDALVAVRDDLRTEEAVAA
jgi:hypothetical protein